MRILGIAIFVFLVFNLQVFSEKLYTFIEISKPKQLVVDDDFVYIADKDNYSVYIYDINNFKLVSRILKKGEGPQESNILPEINTSKEKIVISNSTKVMLYTKKLEFIRELKPGFYFPFLKPLKTNYAILNYNKSINKRSYSVLTFYDKNFNKIKDILLGARKRRTNLIFPLNHICCWEDKIYLYTPGDVFCIEVYDNCGEKKSEIITDLPKIKSTERHRERFKEYSLDALGKRLYYRGLSRNRYKKPLPKYLPDVKEMTVVDDKIYIKTFDVDSRNIRDKYIIMDLKGKILSTVYLPKAFLGKYAIKNGKFYYLQDNESEEAWELHIHRIDLQ